MPLKINYNSPSELNSFMKNNGLGMRKKYGQNFLINPEQRKQLVDALELGGGEELWEIGAGLGAMTEELLNRGVSLTAFEIDPAFCKVLSELFSSNTLFKLIEGDVFKTYPDQIFNERLFLFGNLPYNIAAALLADFIEHNIIFNRAVITVQKEVALRMAAGVNTKHYSSFSILCSSVYKVSLLNTIKGKSFYPVPNVDSQGVRLDKLEKINKLPVLFFPMVRSFFSARRKIIRNSMASFLQNNGAKLTGDFEEIFIKSNIKKERRPETLDMEDYKKLAILAEEYINNV